MPQAIPQGLTQEHILRVLIDLDGGIAHSFGEPTGYQLVHGDKRYAPKAVVGLAFRHAIGRILQPEEFSGGESPGQANFVLRNLGFAVEPMVALAGDFTEEARLAEDEREHRFKLWAELRARGGPSGIAPTVLRELGIYGGAQGIWVDKNRTSKITALGGGVTVAVLHTGSSYSDDLADDCIIYHYPQTNRPASRDLAEINATKAAGRLKLPFFVITYPSPASTVRNVQLGWVESWDDESRTFLITFGEERPRLSEAEDEDLPFVLAVEVPATRREVNVRRGQQRFKFRVFKRYGPECAVCGLAVADLLDAAHICPKLAAGSDDPRNGLVLCANHHRAFDAGLFGIKPESLEIHCWPSGPDAAALGIRFTSLVHLRKLPHSDAILWLWENSRGKSP